jgi:hypothetical protein
MFNKFLIAGAMIVAPIAASAATISVGIFDSVTYNGSYGSTAGAATLDFEALGASHGRGEVAPGLATNVGTFTTLGGTGSGGTVSGLAGNTGKNLALRDGNVFGRMNTTPTGGKWFLDSNDTWGLTWNVGLAGGQAFTGLAFSLMDASDVGAFMRIMTGTDSYEVRTGAQLGNANTKIVDISFGAEVTSATVTLGNFKTRGGSKFFLNDGFSIDGLQVYGVPPLSEVPVPASALLLGSALAGIGAMRRRRKTA